MKIIDLRFGWLSMILVTFSCRLSAQTLLPLTDLSFFHDPGSSWHIVGDVNSGFAEHAPLVLSTGTGILANISDHIQTGKDIFSQQAFGGVDVETDFMMAPGSNSGIYLQGRYEVQLRDSWGTVQPTSADNGGIYERWDDSKPEGQKGFDGHAPRQNVSRAPGLWQHIKISFKPPVFNPAGQKTEQARILRVELNGVTIQENIELSGPTRGAVGQDEVPLAPLRIQGDHGSVAFRNIKITPYNSPRPEILDLKYEIFKGRFEDDLSYKKHPPEQSGQTEQITLNIASFPPVFLIRFSGKLRVIQPGIYHFGMGFAGGRGSLKVSGRDVILLGQGHGQGSGDIDLGTGEYSFELIYSKLVTWDKPAIFLNASGPGIRTFFISDANVGAEHENPILVEAPVNTLLRSFSDIDTFKVTHAVNVGSPLQVHYTYDLDKGMIVQVWRGDFLDVSSMWHGRGDGTPHPMGMTEQFGRPVPALERLTSNTSVWSSDTSGTGFRPKGYVMTGTDLPVFKYFSYGALVSDSIEVLPGGQGVHRKISVDKTSDILYLKLATASTIEKTGNGVYTLDRKTYYIRMDESGNTEPLIRDVNGSKELIVPVSKEIGYSILF